METTFYKCEECHKLTSAPSVVLPTVYRLGGACLLPTSAGWLVFPLYDATRFSPFYAHHGRLLADGHVPRTFPCRGTFPMSDLLVVKTHYPQWESDIMRAVSKAQDYIHAGICVEMYLGMTMSDVIMREHARR